MPNGMPTFWPRLFNTANHTWIATPITPAKHAALNINRRRYSPEKILSQQKNHKATEKTPKAPDI